MSAAPLASPRSVVVVRLRGAGCVFAEDEAQLLIAEATSPSDLAAMLDRVALYAVDIDPIAVRCARRNVRAAAQVYEGDLYEPLPAMLRGGVDVLVANAPYVPTEAVRLLPSEARVHEPRVALDGGVD